MAEYPRIKGPWIHRFLTVLFSIVFAMLCFWLTGFIVDDLGSSAAPCCSESRS
jgi:hypothetical protein